MQSLVKALRQERDLPLEELGRITGMSKSYLSKVERGVSTPSIAAALKIAAALSVDVSRLFVDGGKQSTIAVDRLEGRDATASPHPLAVDMLGKTMSPFLLHPGWEFIQHESHHPGEELVFVHRGAIELHYDGDPVVLNAGESAYVDASRPHRLRAVSETESQVLVVTAAPRG